MGESDRSAHHAKRDQRCVVPDEGSNWPAFASETASFLPPSPWPGLQSPCEDRLGITRSNFSKHGGSIEHSAGEKS